MSEEQRIGQLRIWHNSNFGHPNFERDVPDVATAMLLLDVLADYDLYQGEWVQANAQGLIEWDGEEWVHWEDDEGRTIDDMRDMAAQQADVAARAADRVAREERHGHDD